MNRKTFKKTVLFSTLLSSFSAQAAGQRPVLGMSSVNGWGPFPSSFKCEIYSDVTVITQTSMGKTTVANLEQKLDASKLALLAAAADGELVQSEGPTDIPSTSYYGFNQETAEKIILGGASSGVFITNESPEAAVLKDLITSLCY